MQDLIFEHATGRQLHSDVYLALINRDYDLAHDVVQTFNQAIDLCKSAKLPAEGQLHNDFVTVAEASTRGHKEVDVCKGSIHLIL